MSDGYGEARRRPGGRRSVAVAAAVAAVVVLSAVGGAGGWLLAGDPAANRRLDPAMPTGTAATSAPPDGVGGTEPSGSPRAASPPATGPTVGPFVLPDFTDMDFALVRRELRQHGLGWRLVFAPSGDDRTVERTWPEAGSPVRRGVTVAVFVRGAAPPATVPGVTGLTCRDAAALVVEQGLYPRYPAGQRGRVVQQDPQPPGDLHWNDRVRLVCRAD
jgi:hypothetical protein